MARILVTGSTGFIGRRLVRHLLDVGCDVRVMVRPTSDLTLLPRNDLELAYAELPDDEAVRQAVCGVDGVIHLASLLKVPWKKEFYTVNVQGTACVANACAAQENPPVLVSVSSLAAAGPSRPGVPAREGDSEQPVSAYGRTKLGAEETVDRVAAEVPVSIVRPPMVLGAGDSSSLPLFTSVNRGWHMVPTRKPMFVSAIHVDDLCTALFRVFQSGERRVLGDAGASGIYYAAADEILQYADLGRLVAQALGRNGVRVLKIPAWASYLGACFAEGVSRLSGRTQILSRDKWREATAGDWTCDAARLREQLGWAPGRSLLERLTETVHGYREAGQL